MGELFWYYLVYGFLGFLLEVTFAHLIRSPKPDRKCHLLLPVCPVYSVGALAILALPSLIKEIPLLLYLAGGFVATTVEWLVSNFYEKTAGVSFWDYRGLPLNLNGRVCLWFSLFWGLLALLLIDRIHPLVVSLVSMLPPALTLPTAALYLTDALFSLAVLRRSGTQGLRWYLGLRPSEAR